MDHKLKKIIYLTLLFFGVITTKAQYVETHANGEVWIDNDGVAIDAHARSYIEVDGVYYMFGEVRKTPANIERDNRFRAFRCYASTDLVNWEFRNTVLTANDIGVNTVGTRVDVLYNAKTKQYVMYFKSKFSDNTSRRYGLATSATVDGKYTLQGRLYPLSNDYGDGTLFKDDDETGYMAYSCLVDGVRHLFVDKLSDDYLKPVETVWSLKAASLSDKREAPVVLKKNGTYYMITSGVTGWRSNQAKYISATSLAGPWSEQIDFGNEDAFDSQASSILTVRGSVDTSFFYVGDRWTTTGPMANSGYLLLPLKFDNNGIMTMDFYETYFIDAPKGLWIPTLPTSTLVHIQKSNALDFAISGENGEPLTLSNDNKNDINQQWEEIRRESGFYSYKKANSDFCIDGGTGGGNGQTIVLSPCNPNNANQQWKKVAIGGDTYHLLKSNALDYALTGGNGGQDGRILSLYFSNPDKQNQQWLFSDSDLVTNISEFDHAVSPFSVYPNPSNDGMYNLSFVADWKVVSIRGSVLLQDNSNQVDLSAFPSGIYILEIGTKKIKLVK